MPSASDSPSPSGPSSSSSASTSSVIGALTLVGAAAGYAALALRFRNFSGTGAGSGSAEMKAAQAFAKLDMKAAEAFSAEWARSMGGAHRAEGFRKAHEWARAQQARARPGHQQQQQQQQQQQSGDDAFRQWRERGLGGFAGSGAPAWAMRGLDARPGANPTRQDVTQAYYQRARVLHPDAGAESDGEAFSRLNIAFVEAKRHIE